MPKQALVLNEFHGGMNNEADARDILDNEFGMINNFRVDQLGKISLTGLFAAHKTVTSTGVNPGMGLFAWSSDIQNATGKCDNGSGISGTQDGGNNATLLTDSGETFPVNKMVGATLKNTTGSCEGVVTANTVTTITTEARIRITGIADGTDGDATDIEITTASAHGLIAAQNILITGTQNYNGAYTDLDQIGSTTTFDVTATYVAEQPSVSALVTSHLAGGSENDWDDGDGWQLHNLENSTVGDNYLVYMDADASNNFYVYSHNWSHESAAKSIGGSQIPEPVFYQADGNLRVGDGNFANNSSNKWYGHIKRGRFNNIPTEAPCANAKQSFNEWHLTDQWVKRPPRNTTSVIESPMNVLEEFDAYATDTGWPAGILPAGIMRLTESNFKFTDGLMQGYKKYWYSYIYDGIQESPLRGFLSFSSVFENSKKRYRLTFNPTSLDKRITGVRVYWQHISSEAIAEDDIYLLFEADLDLGVKKANVDTYEPWEENNIGGVFHVRNENMIEFESEPRLYTYAALSGVSADETCSFAKYKTAVVANRRTYYGNVLLHHDAGADLEDGIRLEHRGDAMIKSPVNAFDTIPSGGLIEAVINDGDEIIKLEEFADRILQFKRNKLYVLNISQDMIFLESTFDHRGITNPGASVRTDLGVAFINENGAFLYDGKQITNLFDGKVGTRINSSDWATFIGSNPIIGYDTINGNLVIRGAANSAANNGNCYIFNLKVFAWIEADDLLTDSTDSTNFTTDYDGKLIIKDGATAIEYYNTNGSNAVTSSFKTKDLDFGNVGTKKKVYKVRVTYKSGGNVPVLTYFINQNGAARGFSGVFATSQTQWATAEFTSSGSDTYLNNLYSLQLALTGSTLSGFEINDITIIFRAKRAK